LTLSTAFNSLHQFIKKHHKKSIIAAQRPAAAMLFVGVMISFVAIYLIFGVYESMWMNFQPFSAIFN